MSHIFQKLNLSVESPTLLNWIEPLARESLRSYALRLYDAHVQTDERVVIIGHSLGGIVAQEIASEREVDRIILLSSIKSRAEMPWIFRNARRLGLTHLFNRGLSLSTFRFWAVRHGFRQNEQQELFRSMLQRQSNHYLKWALKSLACWRAPSIPAGTELIQIHGTDDLTFPISKISHCQYKIPDGTHFMVYNLAEHISTILNEYLEVH